MLSSGPTPAKPQSSICLLWLVICKTARLQLANTLTTVIIIVGPIVVFVIYSASVLFREPQQEPMKEHPPINITTKRPYVYYSPDNLVVAGLIEDVVRDLKATGSQAFPNAHKLNDALVTRDEHGFVGIEFDDSFSGIDALPDKVTVALRFPLHLFSNPKLRWDSSAIYKHSNLETDYYIVEGFLVVQAKLSEALIRAKNENARLPEVFLKRYPKPNNEEETVTDNRVALAGSFLFLPFSISAAYLAQMIVMERRQHLRAMLQLLGVRSWVYWLSWFLVGFVLLSIPTLFMVILLKWRFYPLSNYSVVLVFFLVYNLEILSSAFMFSVFFSDTVGVQVAILVVHLLSGLPWRLLLMGYRPTYFRAIFALFFLNSSLAMGLRDIINNENLNLGSSWSEFFKGTDPVGLITLGPILMFMLLGSLVHLLILAYVEKLRSFGRRKWYYPLQPSFWCPRKRRPRSRAGDIENQHQEEAWPRNRQLVIRARELDKIYNERYSVNYLNLDFYQDEVTVILGHNDSGKSTVLMLLAGFVEPSSGKVTINGYDMVTETRKARRSMFICPQQNVLYEKLKTRWHLKFYCRLKGMNRKEASAEADRYLEIGKLQDFANVKVMDLPSGLKRMLLLCCGLCANSKILLLDEPGTSLDPLLRREMWDLLRKERKGRCIILSTHNVHEAEVVSDQIVVLCDGEVLGYGTQVSDAGSFYLLICTKMYACEVSEVTHFLQNRLEDIRLHDEYGVFVSYELPTKHVPQFAALFLDFERALVDLKIQEFSVRAPTLGSAFLRIGEEMMEAANKRDSHNVMVRSSPMASLIDILPSFEVREDNGRQKCCNQWRAIMEKKRLFAWRHRKLYCLIILLPIIICLLVIGFDVILFMIEHELSELLVTDLSPYSKPVFVIKSDDENNMLVKSYRQIVVSQGADVQDTGETALHEYLLNQMKVDETKVQRSFLAGATFNSEENSITAWSNYNLEHGSPLSLGLVYAAIGQGLSNLDIAIVNKPYQDSFSFQLGSLSSQSSVEYVMLVFLYLILATSIFAVLPVTERQNFEQHLQFSSGMSRITYWCSHLFWDFCLFVLMVISVIILAGLTSGSVISLTIILFAFGFSVISFTYLLGLLSNDLGRMFSIILYVNMIGILALFIHPKSNEFRYSFFEAVLLIHPHYSLFCGLQDIIKMDKFLHAYGSEIQYAGSDNPEEPSHPYTFRNLNYLIVTGLVYFTLVLMTWVPRRIKYLYQAVRNEKVEPNFQFEDIEVNKIRQKLDLLTTRQYSRYPLILKNVSKRYGNLLAVRSLSLALDPYECVGLLGRNGAGKSSTFYMISGKQSITVGSIHIKGFSLKRHPKNGLRHLGFCPREEMLSPYMTGREALRFWCMVNGIRRSHIRSLVNWMADCFGLVRHLDKRISTYSNGTKRKLMIAMAILAPTLMCLDEPTAGVDMHAKYEIWSLLEGIRRSGRAILLTTHSMEECELLCTNVGIMDRGTLLCFGSLSRLKYRFNKGIFIKVKLGTRAEINAANEDWRQLSEVESSAGSSRPPRQRHSSITMSQRSSQRTEVLSLESDNGEDYEPLLQRLEEVFMEDHPYSTVSEKYSNRGIITFCIPTVEIKWSGIFQYMESIKTEMQILYYAVSHTTFEDVFMEFVRKHNQ